MILIMMILWMERDWGGMGTNVVEVDGKSKKKQEMEWVGGWRGGRGAFMKGSRSPFHTRRE